MITFLFKSAIWDLCHTQTLVTRFHAPGFLRASQRLPFLLDHLARHDLLSQGFNPTIRCGGCVQIVIINKLYIKNLPPQQTNELNKPMSY